MRKRERKEERSWREEGRVSAKERGRGVVVGRGGGEEEVESGLTGKARTRQPKVSGAGEMKWA